MMTLFLQRCSRRWPLLAAVLALAATIAAAQAPEPRPVTAPPANAAATRPPRPAGDLPAQTPPDATEDDGQAADTPEREAAHDEPDVEPAPVEAATEAPEQPPTPAPAPPPATPTEPAPNLEPPPPGEPPPTEAASSPPAMPHRRARLSTALERDPLGFNVGTLYAVGEDLAAVQSDPTAMLVPLGAAPALTLIGILALLVLTIAGRIWERRAQRALPSLSEAWEQLPSPTLRALALLVVRPALAMLLPGALWVLWRLFTALFGLSGPLAAGASDVLVVWMVCRAVVSLLHEMLVEQQQQLAAERALPLFRGLRRAARVGGVLMALVLLSDHSGYREDVTALLYTLFYLVTGLVALFGLRRRDDVWALVPRGERPWVDGASRLLRRLYYPLLMISALVLALQATGFRQLAELFFTRGWLLFGMALAAMLVHRLAERLLTECLRLAPAGGAGETALRMETSLMRGIGFLVVMALAVGATYVLDLDGAMVAIGELAPFGAISARLTLGSLARAALIIVALLWAASLLARFLDHAVYPQLALHAGARYSINRLLLYVTWTAAFLVSLYTAGVPAQSMALVAGGLSVGIGLGLQDLAKDLANGLYLLLSRQVGKDDLINVGEVVGRVEDIGIRTTVVRSLTNKRMLVANSLLLAEPLINWTLGDRLVRCDIPFGVSYASDPHEVRRVVLEAADRAGYIQRTPAPQVRLTAFGDSALEFRLLAWVEVPDAGGAGYVESDLNFLIWDALKEHNIEIPFPQRDLHVRSAPALRMFAPPATERAREPADGRDDD